MPATKATGATKKSGAKSVPTTVGKQSKTGDVVCSQAMSRWKSAGGGAMPPGVAAILGKCRAKAHALKMGKAYRESGHEAKAQVLEHRVKTGRVGPERRQIAANVAKMRQKKIKERESRHVDKSVTTRRAGKGTREERLGKVRERINVRGRKLAEHVEEIKHHAKKHGYDPSKQVGHVHKSMENLRRRGARVVAKIKGKSLKQQATEHRAGKGTREERIARIRGRGSEIGNKILKRLHKEVKTGKYDRRVHAAHEGRLGSLRGRVRVAAGLKGGRGTTKIRHMAIKPYQMKANVPKLKSIATRPSHIREARADSTAKQYGIPVGPTGVKSPMRGPFIMPPGMKKNTSIQKTPETSRFRRLLSGMKPDKDKNRPKFHDSQHMNEKERKKYTPTRIVKSRPKKGVRFGARVRALKRKVFG